MKSFLEKINDTSVWTGDDDDGADLNSLSSSTGTLSSTSNENNGLGLGFAATNGGGGGSVSSNADHDHYDDFDDVDVGEQQVVRVEIDHDATGTAAVAAAPAAATLRPTASGSPHSPQQQQHHAAGQVDNDDNEQNNSHCGNISSNGSSQGHGDQAENVAHAMNDREDDYGFFEQNDHLQELPQVHNVLVAQSIQNEMYAGTNFALHNMLRNHPLASSILFRVALCEERPLVRAEIDWKLLQKQIPTYPALRVGDELGSHLLQSVLRNDPPCEVIRDVIKHYPKSCVNMDSFYAACQHASDDAVQLLMRRTMKARKIEGIQWGMLAFLGDARIRVRHARFLLQCTPEALIDPMHGMFGVSPLDRMICGAFIHGGYAEWVVKLKLALWTAEKGSLSGWGYGHRQFNAFHLLVKRLVSKNFLGVQFGALSFVNCLTACVEAEANNSSPAFHQLDERGNLPLHVVLQQQCNTNLGVTGERKLIKFLLNANPESAIARDEFGKVPIVLAVENGWPVYDIIAKACPAEYTEGGNCKNCGTNLLIHDVLCSKIHQRLGVTGARSLIKFILKTFPSSVDKPNEEGCLPLHLAIEHGWPCHDMLVKAFPYGLEVKDPRSGFYPFLLATNAESQVNDKKESAELCTLFELIKWGPLLLKAGKANLKSSDNANLKSCNDATANLKSCDDIKVAEKRKMDDICAETPAQKKQCVQD